MVLACFSFNSLIVLDAHADAGHNKMEAVADKMEGGHDKMEAVDDKMVSAKHSEDSVP